MANVPLKDLENVTDFPKASLSDLSLTQLNTH